MSEMHVEAVRAESSRAQARFEKQMNRLEKELSSCQDAKRRLEAEIAMSMHGSHASRTHSGGAARNGSSGMGTLNMTVMHTAVFRAQRVSHSACAGGEVLGLGYVAALTLLESVLPFRMFHLGTTHWEFRTSVGKKAHSENIYTMCLDVWRTPLQPVHVQVEYHACRGARGNHQQRKRHESPQQRGILGAGHPTRATRVS